MIQILDQSPILEEFICSVCQEIYQNPYTLKECLHTFCCECIDKLKQGGSVRCPECRTYTDSTQVKKNFKVQKLLDLHGRMNSENQDMNSLTKECGLCQEKSKQIHFYCRNCGYVICSICHKVHLRSEDLKSHQLKPVSEILKNYDSKIQQNIKELQQCVVDIDSQLSNVALSLRGIEQSDDYQLKISDVRKFTQKIVNEANRNEKRLEQLINNKNGDLKKNLKETERILKSYKEQTLSNIRILEEMKKSQDVQDLQ